MKSLKKSFLYLILIIFIVPLPAHSKMYIWTDENGVKHVSNTAPPQNIKNIQEKDEQKFDEEKYQRSKEQQKIDDGKKAAEKAAEKEKNKQREAESLHNKKLREKERLANSFFEKMGVLSGKKFGDRRGNVLRGIGNSLLSCPGTDLNTAMRYYREAESIVNKISKCEQSLPIGSGAPFGEKYYRVSCMDKLIENAMNQKKAGDSYMGCSPEYIKTVEMEERIKRAERRAKRAETMSIINQAIINN